MIAILLIGVVAMGFIIYRGAKKNAPADTAEDSLGPHAVRAPAAGEDDGGWDDGD